MERETTKVATVLARWQTNQHELGDGRRALYWLAPKVAHSCEPNVGWEDPDACGHVELRALRRIAKDEVLGVNYMDEAFLRLPLDARRRRLREERKFVCACERCRQEAGEQASDHGVALSGWHSRSVSEPPPRVQLVQELALDPKCRGKGAKEVPLMERVADGCCGSSDLAVPEVVSG